jgi:hypothetical protein
VAVNDAFYLFIVGRSRYCGGERCVLLVHCRKE